MDILRILGDILAHQTNLSPPAGRGLIKLAIKDQLGPFTPLEEVDYANLKIVISNSLKNRLIDLEVNDWESLVEALLDELNKNQSIFTMSKV